MHPRELISEALSELNFPDHTLYCEGEPSLLFTENMTFNARLFNDQNASAFREGRDQRLLNTGDAKR